MREKTEWLTDEAARVGLKLNATIDKKVQDANVRTEYATCEERIMLNGEQVEDVDEFVYLGPIVSIQFKEGGSNMDARLQKARWEVQFKDYERYGRPEE